MALSLIDAVVALDKNMVVIRFQTTIKISSLVNSNFILQTNEATPTVLSNPFDTIETIVDYNQISRTLKLYWHKNLTLVTGTSYLIRLVNFLDAANETVGEEQILFEWQGDSATPSSFSSVRAPEVGEVLVEDKSIRTDAFTSVQILAKNPDFYIADIVPSNGDFYLENNYNNGRVKIVFNSRPASNFLNNTYFKAQRKKYKEHLLGGKTFLQEYKCIPGKQKYMLISHHFQMQRQHTILMIKIILKVDINTEL